MSILSRALSSSRRKFNAPPDRNRQHQLMTWQQREQGPSISNGSTESRMDHEEIPPPVDNKANLDRFLESAAPVVRVRHLPKTIIRHPLGRTIEIEHPPYFVLKDLWDSFDKSKLLPVPLVLYGTDSVEYSVTQYYVPFLSGIQLYVHPKRPPTQRTPSWETGSYCRNNPVQGDRSHAEFADENITRLTKLSHVNRPFRGQWGVETRPLGERVFEYFEKDQPPERRPLFARIKALASEFPALMTYRSCDLSPSSWIAVLWFPVYRKPEATNLPDMDACFVTYHCLSTEPPSISANSPPFRGFNVRDIHSAEMPSRLPLYIFGLAFFKMRLSLWVVNEDMESPTCLVLLRAAKNWLKHLKVRHPDFDTCAARPLA